MFGKLISPETKIKSEGREFFEGLQAKRPSDSGELRAGPELESEVNDQPSSPNPTTSPGGADPHARARRGTRPPKPLRGAVDKEALKESLADAGASSSAENGQEGGSPPADDEFAHVRRRIRPNPQASEPLKPAEPKPGLRILPKPKR